MKYGMKTARATATRGLCHPQLKCVASKCLQYAPRLPVRERGRLGNDLLPAAMPSLRANMTYGVCVLRSRPGPQVIESALVLVTWS